MHMRRTITIDLDLDIKEVRIEVELEERTSYLDGEQIEVEHHVVRTSLIVR